MGKPTDAELSFVLIAFANIALVNRVSILEIINNDNHWLDVVDNLTRTFSMDRDRAVYLIGGERGAGGPGFYFAAKLNSVI